jgi:N6-L-threonylcarbamoyladenine synthase
MICGAGCVLGIDTSNYTTSVALAGMDGQVLADARRLLAVKTGERGLRQSEAFFQHVECLPSLLGGVLDKYRADICAVAVSDRPRSAEGSYMPAFNAGARFAQALAQALGKPLFMFSHQDGHIRAGMHGSALSGQGSFLAWHLSGGTSELLLISRHGDGAEARGAAGAFYDIRIIGGSLDISFGQLLDRLGVRLGYSFPAGKALDEAALAASGGGDAAKGRSELGGDAAKGRSELGGDAAKAEICKGRSKAKAETGVGRSGPLLTRVPLKGLYCNLSGIETQSARLAGHCDSAALISEVFSQATAAIGTITERAAAEHGISEILFTGGVAASAYLRKNLVLNGAKAVFGEPKLSSDNAVGIALLGVDRLSRREAGPAMI